MLRNTINWVNDNGQTAVVRGRFAVLSLRRDFFLVVRSTNIHDTYLNTQLRYVYIDISIIEIDAQTDM